MKEKTKEALYAERQKAKKNIKVCVWIAEENAPRLKKYAKRLRNK